MFFFIHKMVYANKVRFLNGTDDKPALYHPKSERVRNLSPYCDVSGLQNIMTTRQLFKD